MIAAEFAFVVMALAVQMHQVEFIDQSLALEQVQRPVDNLPSDWTLRLSSGFGLNDNSHRLLLRWGVSREFSGFGETVRRWFGGRP